MTPEALVRDFIARAWNQGELELVDQRVAPQYVRRVPGEIVRGPDGFKARIRATREAMPDFHSHVDRVVADADTGAVLWTATATHSRELFGFAPTGRALRWSGITWFRTAGGQLVEEWELFDRLDVLAQLEARSEPAAQSIASDG